MGTNEHVIVGPPRSMILFKPPASPAPEHARLLNAVDVIGPYRDGFFLATCSQKKLAKLREAGAEVVVIDPDANNYAAETGEMSDDARIAMVDDRMTERRSDMAVADAGSGGPDDEGTA